MRPDEASERQREKARPDHACDPHYAAVRALQLSLLRRPDVTRHQGWRRRPDKPHEREDWERAQEGDSRRSQAVDRIADASAENAREERQPFAEAGDYPLDQGALHNDVEYSDDRQRQPGCELVPAIT